MADTRVDMTRSVEQRAGKTAQAQTGAKSAATDEGALPSGFASLLAAFDGAPVQVQSDVMALNEHSALGYAVGMSQAEQLQGEPVKLPLPELSQAIQEQAPWMSLVGQTAQLDGQRDSDLRRGVATDFLSGRGDITQLAHRQSLLGGTWDAHAAFMGQTSSQDSFLPIAGQSYSAMTSDASAQPLMPSVSDGKSQPAPMMADVQEESLVVKGEETAHRQQTSAQHGFGLQGMTQVQPQLAEGLKDLLGSARSSQLNEMGSSVGKGRMQAASDMQGETVAVGAAMGAANASMQGGSQNGGESAQALSEQGVPVSEREQDASEQVAFWVHQKMQHAALSIQHEGRPIQVQVQLNGQEAHVRFAADDEQARQLLSDGQAQLRELLHDQGLSLGGVSVDAGGAHHEGRQEKNSQQERAGTAWVSVSMGAQEGMESMGRRSSRGSSAGVDLFV